MLPLKSYKKTASFRCIGFNIKLRYVTSSAKEKGELIALFYNSNNQDQQ